MTIKILEINEPRILQVEITSDWNLASGSGRLTSVDSAVRRTGELPYVTGTEMTGLVRAAALEVAKALDAENVDPQTPGMNWQKWVAELFGREGGGNGAAIMIRPAYPSEEVPTIIQSGVSIDEKGVAKEDHLWFVEKAAATKLISNVELLLEDTTGRAICWDDEWRKQVTIIVGAACGIIESLGGRRTRGGGRCKISMQDAVPKECAAGLRELISKAPSPLRRRSREASQIAALPTDQNWVEIPIMMKLKQPLHSTGERRSNTQHSHDYIRGTALLPWVHKSLLKVVTENDVDPQIIGEVENAVGAGRLRVDDLRRSTPADAKTYCEPYNVLPMSLALSKIRSSGDFDEYIINTLSSNKDTGKSVRLKKIRNRIGIVRENTIIVASKVQMTSSIHTALERGGTIAKEGSLHVIEAIDSGQIFSGKIWIHDELFNHIENALKNKLVLESVFSGLTSIVGNCRTEFGLVDITSFLPIKLCNSQTKNVSAQAATALWFKSDSILLSPGLGPGSIRDLPAELSRHGVKANIESFEEHEVVIARHRRIDSYHQYARKPRPTFNAILAGSIVKIVLQNPEKDRAILAQLGKIGIGSRTAEGYGRFEIVDHLLSERQYKEENNA